MGVVGQAEGVRQGPSGEGLRGKLPAIYKEHRSKFRAVISIIAVSLLWEVVARYIVNSALILVPLTSIWSAFVKLLMTGELQKHVWVSFQEFGLGFTLAAVAGIVLGILMATSDVVRDYLDPWVSALYATPTIALAPLFILWFGIDIASKIAVIFLAAVFPILINTYAGIQATDNTLIEAARSFGASRMQIFTKILVPSALPFIIAGLRLGVGRGLVGVVVGELFGARAGLGFLITVSGQVFDTAGLFVGVLFLAIAGVIAVEGLKRVEHHMAPWRHFGYKV
ncbi:MAG: ABC transporter permease [Chloroflexi bacterium]|nr:ABC transporter permease [Chloroflexota bacterium]